MTQPPRDGSIYGSASVYGSRSAPPPRPSDDADDGDARPTSTAPDQAAPPSAGAPPPRVTVIGPDGSNRIANTPPPRTASPGGATIGAAAVPTGSAAIAPPPAAVAGSIAPPAATPPLAPAQGQSPAQGLLPAPSTARPAEPDLWSTRATTTRGMIGRPANRAAIDAAGTSVPTGGTATIGAPLAGAAAAAATGLATTAIPDVQARAVEVVPDPPRNGTVYGRPQTDRSGKVLSGRMARLHIGWHSASMSAVSLIGAPTAGTGLIIGADRHGRGVPVRFFRPEPTRVTLIGGDWARIVLVLRALALGAYVSVWTDDPHRWLSLGERATGTSGRMAINAAQAMLPTATSLQPVLSIIDTGSPGAVGGAPGAVGDSPGAGASGGSPGASGDAERGAWHTELTVLRQLDERGTPAIQDSHLVIAQRLGSAESAIIASALRVPGFVTTPLQQIDDETLALLGPTDPQYVRMSATEIERGLAGSARR